MAEFRLPANSRVNSQGKVFKAPAGAKHVRTFKIYRYDPHGEENPRVDTYEVDMDACGPMVLDALIKIIDNPNGAKVRAVFSFTTLDSP